MNGRLIRTAVVLISVCALIGVTTTFAQSKQSTAATSQSSVQRMEVSKATASVDPRRADHTIDLRPYIKKMSLREGANLVTETTDGHRVYAVVQVTDIVVKDASGRELKELKQISGRPTTPPHSGISSTQVAAPDGQSGDDEPRCWHCYEIDGQTHCFEINCPFITAPGTGGNP